MTNQINLGGLGRSEDLVDKGRELGSAVLHLVQAGNEVDSGKGTVSQAVHTVSSSLQAGTHVDPVVVLVGDLWEEVCKKRVEVGGNKDEMDASVTCTRRKKPSSTRYFSGFSGTKTTKYTKRKQSY